MRLPALVGLALYLLGCGDFGVLHIVPETHETATLSGDLYTRGDSTGKRLHLSSLKTPYRIEKKARAEDDIVRAVLLRGDEVVAELDSLQDLQGYVEIDSPEEAIEYVRFRTSDQTYSLFQPRVLVEVTRRSSILGIEIAKGTFGVASAPFFDRHRLSELRVRREGDRFVINRFAVMTLWPGAEGHPKPPALHRLTERVFSDGSYEVEEEPVLERFDSADVIYPGEPGE